MPKSKEELLVEKCEKMDVAIEKVISGYGEIKDIMDSVDDNEAIALTTKILGMNGKLEEIL